MRSHCSRSNFFPSFFSQPLSCLPSYSSVVLRGSHRCSPESASVARGNVVEKFAIVMTISKVPGSLPMRFVTDGSSDGHAAWTRLRATVRLQASLPTVHSGSPSSLRTKLKSNAPVDPCLCSSLLPHQPVTSLQYTSAFGQICPSCMGPHLMLLRTGEIVRESDDSRLARFPGNARLLPASLSMASMILSAIPMCIRSRDLPLATTVRKF